MRAIVKLNRAKLMKRSLLIAALILSGCATVEPVKKVAPPPAPVAPKPEPELVPNEVTNTASTEAIAMDFGLFVIDRDATFTGTISCTTRKCSGAQYQLNIYQDGRFEARREDLDKNTIELIEGSWQQDDRTLHFTAKGFHVPSFVFVNSQQLSLLEHAGKPTVSTDNFTLVQTPEFTRLDTRMPLLGLYQVKGNEASFMDCQSGESLQVAMTQHHLPMLRNYQADQNLNGKSVLTSMVARKSPDQGNSLFVDKFDRFWPGANCPDKLSPGKIEGVVWRLRTVSQIGVPAKLNIRMMFDGAERLSGFSGCNNFNANYQQKDNQLKVLAVNSTRKSCADANFYEQQFTRQLQVADRIEVNQARLQLYKDNKVIMEFLPAVN